MNDTRKITLISISALVLAFAGLYIYVELYEFTQFTSSEPKNISSIPPLAEKRIFIFGGSSSIVLNNTHIEEYLSDRGFNEFSVYNFAWVADTPSKRLNSLDKLISAEPTLVFYGLGVQHMGYLSTLKPRNCLNPDESKINPFINPQGDSSRIEKTLAFLPKEIEGLPTVDDAIKSFEQIFQIKSDQSSNLANPKHVTVNILRIFFEGDSAEINKIKNPGFIDPKLFDLVSLIQFSEITSLEKLNEPLPYITSVCPEDLKKEISSLKEIYSKLHEKNIKFVIYLTPYVQSFLDTLGETEVDNFHSLIEEFSRENNVNFYSLHDKYVELEIFNDWSHVAINPASIIFSNDVAEIILKNLGTTNLRYVDTTNNDLRFMNLSYADFRGADLSNKDLTGADLHNSNLFGVKLDGTNLRETNLSYAYLRESDLSNKDLSGTILVGANLAGSNLNNVSLSGKDLTATDLSKVDLSNKDLTGTILTRAKLDYANLDGVDLSGKDLSGTSMRGVDLSGKDFTGSYFHLADLSFANLSGANFVGAQMPKVNFTSTDLSYADLSNAFLFNSDFINANLQNTILEGADLWYANLSNAYLVNSDFTNANLTDAYLVNSNFTNANLQNTILEGADLLNAILSCFNNPICK